MERFGLCEAVLAFACKSIQEYSNNFRFKPRPLERLGFGKLDRGGRRPLDCGLNSGHSTAASFREEVGSESGSEARPSLASEPRTRVRFLARTRTRGRGCASESESESAASSRILGRYLAPVAYTVQKINGNHESKHRILWKDLEYEYTVGRL